MAHFDFGAVVPSDFVFSADGRLLYGSSYYTGVSNIFRYDLDARSSSAVSNTDTGLFRPDSARRRRAASSFRFTGAGFVPTHDDREAA